MSDKESAQRTGRLRQAGLIAFEAALFAAYAWLRIQNAGFIRQPRASFGDAADYLFIASQSLLSSQFWLADKPFLIPLFFKMLGSNPQLIFTVQLSLSILCWGALAASCALILRPYALKFLAFAVVLGFSLNQQIILWDSVILSESLNFSLWALFYACALLLCHTWSRARAAVLIALAVLLVWARDANAYVLLEAGVILLLLAILRRHAGRFLLVGGAFVAVFAMSAALSSAGAHAYTALLNVIGLRVLPNAEYLAYFEGQGMPVSEALLEYTGKAGHWDDLALMHDTRLEEFRTWLRERGTGVFARFLWHFKADTLQKPLADPVAVLAPDLYYFSATRFRPILEGSRAAEILYPMRFGIAAFGAASLLAAFMAALALRDRRTLWLAPILMILLAYPQIVFVWNTDPNDIFRHALPLNVQWRLGLWLLLFLGAGTLLEESMHGRGTGVAMRANEKGEEGEYWKKNLLVWEAGAYYRDAGGRMPVSERVAALLRGNGMYVRMDAALRMAAPHVKGLTVMDIGCGSGRFALKLAEAGAKSVIGVDISPDAIKMAERRRESSPHRKRLTFRVADLSEPGTRLPKVDLVTALGVLEYFDEAGMDQLLGKLKTRYFLFDFPDAQGRTRTWLLWALRQVYLRIKGCPGVYLYTQEEFRALAGRHGFKNVRFARRSIFDFTTNLPAP
jgi:SAM-dependent methyltransferase